MNKKILITIIILTIFLIGGYFMKNFLIDSFKEKNKNVVLGRRSDAIFPDPWEARKDRLESTKKELMENYYQKKYKGLIILDYKQIEIQNEACKYRAEMEQIFKGREKAGSIIQITVDNKFKNQFLKDGWKIMPENKQQLQKEIKLKLNEEFTIYHNEVAKLENTDLTITNKDISKRILEESSSGLYNITLGVNIGDIQEDIKLSYSTMKKNEDNISIIWHGYQITIIYADVYHDCSVSLKVTKIDNATIKDSDIDIDIDIESNAEFSFKNEQELADFLDNYYILDNRHKELANGEGIHGWNKAIRKSDYCLLVVAVTMEAESNKTNPGKKTDIEQEKMVITAKEKSIEDLNFWFDRSEDTIREQLKKYNLDKAKVDEIIKSMNKCKIKSNGTMF